MIKLASLPRWVWIAAGAIIFALVAFAVASVVLSGSSAGWNTLAVTTALSGLLVGGAGGGLLFGRVKRVTFWKGAITGLVGSIVIHPVTWYLASLYLFLTGTRSSLGEPTINPLDAVSSSLLFSLLSLLIVGWYTIPLAALGFGILAWHYARSQSSAVQTTEKS